MFKHARVLGFMVLRSWLWWKNRFKIPYHLLPLFFSSYGQGSQAELSSRDFKRELLEAEARAGTGHKDRDTRLGLSLPALIALGVFF